MVNVEARPYKNKDYSMICDWLRARGLKDIPRDLLPPTGFVVEDVACGFLYLTNSSMGIMEHYVSNPSASKPERGEALSLITALLIKTSREKGMKYLSANTAIESIAWLAKKNGFKFIGKQLSFLREV